MAVYHKGKKMKVINEFEVIELLQRTLNHIDERLVDHGIRVAYVLKQMLDVCGKYSKKDVQELCMIALLHDIGAYKTEEIDQMVKFESANIWEHSIYGYLFLKKLSPLQKWAIIVLFHHADASKIEDLTKEQIQLSQMLYVADRVDVFMDNDVFEEDALFAFLSHLTIISPSFEEVVAIFKQVYRKENLYLRLKESITFSQIVDEISLSEEEIDGLLKLITYAIDFRSEHTVSHTITTTRIAYCVANKLKLDAKAVNDVYYGAMLHDLGKIAVPVEILEYPGKLSPQALHVMRSHVLLTKKILGNAFSDKIVKIALYHHEKLDGSGYPFKLKEEELSIEEKIVAIADIVSALVGVRSYKTSYSKEKTISILKQMVDNHKIDREISDTIISNYDNIMNYVISYCQPIIAIYKEMKNEYIELLEMVNQYDVDLKYYL
ncbi:MAG: HD domain-containing protein [Erysipelotrichia bacterium]|nr:HD domain-containing protein [Erysipelotrichia bacterium]NCC53878.1 HD domain-containing protein [Erysipelotrichia bacterium]